MDILDKLRLTWHSSYKINKIRESIFAIFRLGKSTEVIYIFGCQRSGTTIIQKLLSLNINVKFHGEGDLPYFYDPKSDKHHRLQPIEQLRKLIKKEPLKYIVIKPLYESHFANELLSALPNSKGIWVFRNYLDVIDSHIHYYKQNAIEYIAPLYSDDTDSWLNENLPEDIKEFLNRFSPDELTDADAYGLFWIVRNSLYRNVSDNDNILLVNYEKLVNKPEQEIERIYDFTKLKFNKLFCKIIRSNAVSKKVSFSLNPEIEEKCKQLNEELLKQC